MATHEVPLKRRVALVRLQSSLQKNRFSFAIDQAAASLVRSHEELVKVVDVSPTRQVGLVDITALEQLRDTFNQRVEREYNRFNKRCRRRGIYVHAYIPVLQ
jgi:hypothetical protein